MANYFTVLKMLFTSMFRRRTKEKRSGAFIAVTIVMAVLYFMVMGGILMVTNQMANLIRETNIINEFVTIILGISSIVILFLGIFTMLSYLYFSRDTEFFASLPMRPGVVFMAKLTVIYLIELAGTLLFLLPPLFMLSASVGLSPLFVVVVIVALIFVPAVPMAISAILSLPLMYVVSFFRKRSLMATIALILTFVLVFGGYYLFIFSVMGSGGSVGGTLEPNIDVLKDMTTKFSNVFFPFYAIIKFASMTPVFGLNVGLSMVVNLAIFLGTVVALFVLTYVVSQFTYRKSAAAMLESAPTKINANARFKQSTVFNALLKKEWVELLKTPAFAFQCLAGCVLCPFIVFVLTFFQNSITGTSSDMTAAQIEELQKLMSNISAGMGLGMIMMIGVGVNVTCSTTFSREGDKFYYLKMLPIDINTQIKARIALGYIIHSIVGLVSLIILVIVTSKPLLLIVAVPLILIYNYATCCFGVFMDLRKPKLTWNTPNEAVKHNKNLMITTFLSMGICMVFFMVLMGVSTLGLNFMFLVIGIMIVISSALAYTFHKMLYKNAQMYLDRIEL